jgi:Heterokaryon incompatibility protein (HET)
MLTFRRFNPFVTQGYIVLTDPVSASETEPDIELGGIDTDTNKHTGKHFDSPIDLYRNLFIPSGSQFIRLLELDGLPQSIGSESIATSSPLTGRFKITSLSDNSPTFSALSYTWGSSSSSHHIITCNGCAIRVTANLYDALQQIRKQHGPLQIWVDAICINQNDEKEKSEQILLMNQIYSRAQTVYVWLGNGTLESDVAMDSLREAWEIKSLIFGNNSGLISMKAIFYFFKWIKFWRKLLVDPLIYWWICESC